MSQRSGGNSRALLGRLRDTMASEAKGQERLDTITHLIADSMGMRCARSTCFVIPILWNLCHRRFEPRCGAPNSDETRRRLGGSRRQSNKIVNTADAPLPKGFGICPKQGKRFIHLSSGIPIQRLGEKLGVLLCNQNCRVNSHPMKSMP